jgi:uncharacterized protein YndB with AHSA1/START domain
MADTYTVERTASIGASPERVFAAVIDFHEWVHWSPWEELDPNLQRTYSDPAHGVGAEYEWLGNRKAGEGRMLITEADPPRFLQIDLTFLKPFKSQSVTTFTFEPAGEGTATTWRMEGPKTLMTRIMGIFTSMDKLIGRDFEKGLVKLDQHVNS